MCSKHSLLLYEKSTQSWCEPFITQKLITQAILSFCVDLLSRARFPSNECKPQLSFLSLCHTFWVPFCDADFVPSLSYIAGIHIPFSMQSAEITQHGLFCIVLTLSDWTSKLAFAKWLNRKTNFLIGQSRSDWTRKLAFWLVSREVIEREYFLIDQPRGLFVH